MWNFDETIDRNGTSSIKYDFRKDTFGKDEVIPMWVADMDFETPDFIVNALQKRLNHHIYGYTYRSEEYYSSIISWHKKRHNWKIERDWISFTPGVVPALNIATLAFSQPGESIVVQPPVYFPFFSAVEAHGRNLVYNQLTETSDGWKMDFESLINSIDERTRMIIISNPHNPVGRAWSEQELIQLAEICLKNKILILSDEIHSDLVLPGYHHIPIASIAKDISDITITCLAPSKTFNLAGLSTSSVVISNSELKKTFRKTLDSLHLANGNIFGTIASVAAYSDGEAWLDSLLDYIDGNIDYVNEYCSRLIPEILPVKTEATYMIWLDCRKFCMTGKELMKFFVNNAGVGMNEGSTFGPGGEGFMRMNVATSRKNVALAMQQIENAILKIR